MGYVKRVWVSRRSAVKWHVFGGFLGTFVKITQGLIFVPLYIHYFGDRLYGFWLATGGILSWISMVDIGSSAVTKIRCAAAYAQNNMQRVVDYFWHGILVSGIVFCVFLGIAALIVPNLTLWLGIDVEYHEKILVCTWVLVVSTAFGFIMTFLHDFLTALQRSKIPVLGKVGADIFGIGILYLGLVNFHWGLYSLVISTLIKSIIGIFIAVVYTSIVLFRSEKTVVWSKIIFLDYWKTTPAIFAAKASGTFTEYLPIFLVTRHLGPEIAVAYNVTTRVLVIVQSLINHGLSAMYGATAHFFADSAVLDFRKFSIVRRLAWSYIFGAALMMGGYALLNEGFVAIWTTPKHFLGADFVMLSSLSSFLLLRSSLQTSLLGSLGQLRLLGILATIERLTSAALISLFLILFGLNGIPLAASLILIIMGFVHAHWVRRADPTVASALYPLLYSWLPVGFWFFVCVLGSQLFVFPSWKEYTANLLVVSAITVFSFGILIAIVSRVLKKFRLSKIGSVIRM